MENKSTIAVQLFDALTGTWVGEGRGGYPTIKSFDYHETLTFMRYDENTLAYELRTKKRYEGETEWLGSHWQYGFIRILENGELDLMNVQVGRTEVMTGFFESPGAMFRIHFVSQVITGDPRMVSSARRFELDGDTLRYKMEMQTTKTNRLEKHLEVTLQRIK